MNGAPQTDHRIQYRSNRVRERPSVHHRDRILQRARAAHKSRAIRLVLQITDGLAIGGHHMRSPHGRFVVGAFATGREQRANLRCKFRFDKELGKSGVGHIGRWRGQGQLRVRGHLDIARANTQIGNREAANFGIVFGGNHNIELSSQRPVTTNNFGVVLEKDRVVTIRLDRGRLISGGPHVSGLFVAQKNILAPTIPGGIFTPAGDGHVAPTAIAGARGSQHHRVAPVR